MKKQKTLEEAAENHLQKWRLLNNIHLSNILHAERCKNDFIAGAKWQQERMYSEEDLKEAFEDGVGSGKYQEKYGDNAKGSMSFEYFIKQFKKK